MTRARHIAPACDAPPHELKPATITLRCAGARAFDRAATNRERRIVISSSGGPRIDIAAFEVQLFEAAADLLCRFYEASRRAGLNVPGRLLERARALDAIAAPLASGPAVAALEAGRLVGFLHADGATGRIRMERHAAEPDNVRPVLRALYAAAAGDLVKDRVLRHQVDVLAGAEEELAAWFQLGFGIDQIKGLRRPGSAGVEPPPGTRMRIAEDADLHALVDLAMELNSFHEGSPMLRRSDYSRDRAATDLRAAMNDARSAVFLAEAEGRPTAFVEAELERTFDNTATIFMAGTSAPYRGRGIGRALVALADAWAVGRGCDFLGVGWTSANILSDRFWRGLGFQPARYTLARDFHNPPLER